MATIYELKRRAQELSAKKDSSSISPDEVGGLIDETLDVINEAEKNQVGLGIRNTYTTVALMNADSADPVGSDGKPLKFGQIVTVYNESNQESTDNGNIYAFQNPGWKLVSTTGNLSVYAKKEEVENAMSIADQAKTSADSATTIANEAKSTASQAGNAATSAQDAALNANKNSKEASEKADTAIGSAEQAVLASSEALQASVSADATANSAKATASQALLIAQSVAGNIPVINVNTLCGQTTYTTATARTAIADKSILDQTEYRSLGVIIIYITDNETWETKQFTGESLENWNEDIHWKNFGGGSGSGFYNVTLLHPLASGYYTKDTAVVALTDAEIKDEDKPGMIITFEVSAGKWEDYRFCGTSIASFLTPAAWESFGGGDAVKEIYLNGVKQQQDADGKVALIIEKVDVDSSLDSGSTNAISNAPVATKFNEIEANTLFDVEPVVDEESNTVKLIFKNKSGAEITSTEFQGGTGGGSGETGTATKIVLNASVNNTIIKEGGTSLLTYYYDHQYTSGDDKGLSTGQKADITIQLIRGAQVVYTDTISNSSSASYTFDLSKYLFLGTTDVYVKATTTDVEGKMQTKQAYTSVKVVTLSLSSSYNLASNIANGGYAVNDVVSIPFTVYGTGTKVVTLYVDGVQTDTRVVTKSGTSNGVFAVSMGGKSVGRHNVQMVAEMEASAEFTLRSESVYIDILKSGSNLPYIGTMFIDKSGAIFDGQSYLTPRVSARQYEQMSLSYIVYDAGSTPARMNIKKDGVVGQTVSVPRTVQTYNNRFTEKGEVAMQFSCGATNYPFVVDVNDSGMDISEAGYGLTMKLSAAGRSNEEANPAVWKSGDINTTFDGVDFKTSGWTGSSLKLMNGAKINIGCTPFKTDVSTSGCTIEVEFKVSNVYDGESNVISCISENKGFQVTGEKASMYTGSTKQVTDDEGNSVTQPVGVGRQYGKDMWIKAAFIVGKRADGRKMELYINGTRSAADIYAEGDNFMQDTPVGITIESAGADVEVRSVRMYNRALSDDEEVDNYIVDQQTVEAMVKLFEENDVLSDDGLSIDFEKLRKKNKAIMLVVRPGGLDPVNAENNKSADFLSDVYLWLPDGRYIYLHNVYIRIQGTSSTKYPRKNYRIYCAKGESPELYINDVKQSDLKLPLRIGQAAVKILCPKADYSDSSMVQNTGGAQIYNRMMKNLGFLTPPQMLNDSIRVAVDGYPLDIFASETVEGTPQYYGQYNLNHDKSDWYDIIGMKGVAGLVADCPISFEFLNNTQPLCLFQGEVDLDAQAQTEFDDALEFNFPKDVTWSTATDAQKTAFKSLWGWIRDCVPAGANVDDLNTFKSEKFKREVADHFDTNFLKSWYLFTDYHAMVDQRVKNMILVTWDGVKWYFIYYDGDTQLGDRNDSFLAYLYNVTRDTWDAEKSKYAFEGHDSWLWCLLLANMQDELKAMANTMRTALTKEMVNDVFDNTQQANWCARAYNKSGEFKYIIPQIEGVIVGTENVKYPYIYALKGDKRSFRHWFIENRYALLDAKYSTGNYRSDNIDMYMSRIATAPANTIDVTSNELYYFGYGTNNSPYLQASEEADKGEVVTLRFTNAFTVNDPLRLYGASRMSELDMRGSANNITGDLNLNKCNVLRKLNLSTTGAGSNGWCMVMDQCKQLTDININGQKNARTGTLSSTELNFSNQTKLVRLDAGGVNVDGVIFAQGAPLKYVRMSNSIKTLRLEYLPLLADNELVVDGYSNVETFRFATCPKLDCWTILSRCTNVKRIRITGVDMEGDGSFLKEYMTMGGVDETGGNVNTCRLVGRYQLTRYMADAEYEAMCSHFPELIIIQPEYTMIEFDDNISDEYNISNLDNRTGNKYNNAYSPSAHILSIQKARHRVLCKMTGEKESTIYPLHDANSNYYADATSINSASTAKLDGTEGDVMMFEPHYWYKGVNDALNGKKYACFSFNKYRPSTPDCTILRYEDITDIRDGYRLSSAASSIRDALKVDTTCQVLKIPVTGYKRVRYPSAVGGLICALFVDSADVIVKDIVSEGPLGLIDGMYIISDVPQNASGLYFTIRKGLDFDPVVLSNSDKIEDMEPDWAEHEECLVGVHEASYIGSKLASIATMTYSAGSISQGEFSYSAKRRNMQLIDWNMHKDIANRFFAFYGRRDSQDQCGYGSNTNTRIMGETAKLGMRDTINQNHATNGAWYVETDEWGIETIKSIGCNNCMGYENLFGGKAEWLGNVSLPNDPVSEQYKMYIEMPDGTTRKVKISSVGGYMTKVLHQKFMDISSVSSSTGTSTTYYCDEFIPSGAVGRVIFRSNNSAHPQGGVSNSYCGYDSSSTYSHIGSRLAFRGKIVVAASVQAFKALVGIS